MSNVTRISFVTADAAATESLCRTYVVPSSERLASIEGCEGVRFTRFDTDPRYERGGVKLGIRGDAEAVIAAERERRETLADRGVIESWSRDGEPFTDVSEETRAFLADAYQATSQTAAVGHETFDGRPAIVEAVSERGRPYGMADAFHALANAVGHSAAEEVDGYTHLIRDRLVAGTQVYGADETRAWLDDVRAELDATGERIDEIEAAGGFDYYDGPGE